MRPKLARIGPLGRNQKPANGFPRAFNRIRIRWRWVHQKRDVISLAEDNLLMHFLIVGERDFLAFTATSEPRRPQNLGC